MFPGESYGVAVSLARLHPQTEFLPADPHGRSPRLDELLPSEFLSDEELAREIQRAEQAESMVAAYKAERIAALAARRSAAGDRRPGTPGAAAVRDEGLPDGVSEFFPDELAMILNCSRTGATVLTEISQSLLTTLPTTWAALAEGRIDYPRARALAAELAGPARAVDPLVISAVEAAVLPVAGRLSIKQLRAATRRELIARDARAAERRRKAAERTADVHVRSIGDGMAEVVHTTTAPVAAAIVDMADRCARMAKADGDERPLGQLRSAVLADLSLRPWDTSRPPVTAHLTVLAPLPTLQQRPGWVAEVQGEPITAAHVRELLESLDSLGPGGLRTPAGGSVTVGVCDPESGELRATATLQELRRIDRRGCRDHPDQSCACPVLDRPPPIDGYTPALGQKRWLRTRDRTCRHPGCSNDAEWADLDHVIPHAKGGATDCDNLCCLCRRHHRVKTHAPGWSFVLDADGTLSVTTPTGVTRSTRPLGLFGLADLWPVADAELAGSDGDPPPF